MSRILIIAAVFPPEPVVSAQIAYSVATKLAEEHDVTVLCPKPTRPFGFFFGNKDIPKQESFKRIYLNTYTCPQSSLFGRFRENFSFGMATSNYIKKCHQEIDLIYAITWPLFGQYLVIKNGTTYNIPLAVHIQDIYPEVLMSKFRLLAFITKRLFLPIDKFVLQKATSIIAISETMKEYLSDTRNIQKNKISLVYNWQDESQFHFQQKIFIEPKNCFIYMYLGNIGPVAGIDLLIQSFSNANIPNTKLVIAGSGSKKNDLVAMASLLKSNIEFWDVPIGKVAELQGKADVMLLPIKKGAALSSIPSKLPAYMLSSKPIICSADINSATASFIENARCGYLVEPENIDLLSKAMKDMFTQKRTALVEMGANGRRYALEMFSKDRNLHKLTTVINNTLNK